MLLLDCQNYLTHMIEGKFYLSVAVCDLLMLQKILQHFRFSHGEEFFVSLGIILPSGTL